MVVDIDNDRRLSRFSNLHLPLALDVVGEHLLDRGRVNIRTNAIGRSAYLLALEIRRLVVLLRITVDLWREWMRINRLRKVRITDVP